LDIFLQFPSWVHEESPWIEVVASWSPQLIPCPGEEN